MEWFVITNENRSTDDGHRFYRNSCCVLYIICGVLQLLAVCSGANDYCEHLDEVLDIENGNAYCYTQYVGWNLISILLPSILLSGCLEWLNGWDRIRVVVLHLVIAISSLLYYVGFDNLYPDASEYEIIRHSGYLMIAFSFVFANMLSPLFIRLQSDGFATASCFIASVLIIAGLAVVFDVNDFELNVAEWTLFAPMCCLTAYEIQLL